MSNVKYNTGAMCQALNNENNPWLIRPTSDCSMAAEWKWMDARWFMPGKVSHEIQNFRLYIDLFPGMKYRFRDSSETRVTDINPGEKSISFSKSGFSGHSVGKSLSIGIGQNNLTGECGVIVAGFSTNTIKKPIEQYLQSMGFKKKWL